MQKTAVAHLVDRSTRRRLLVEPRWGSGFEALLALRMLNGGVSLDAAQESTAARLPSTVLRAVSRLKTPSGDQWSALLGIAAEVASPCDVGRLLSRISGMQPLEVKLAMLGFQRLTHDPESGADEAVFRAAAGGDRSAGSTLVRRAEIKGHGAEVKPIVRIPAGELVSLVTDAIRDLPPDRYLQEPQAVALLERNAEKTKRLLEGFGDADAVIRRLTFGAEYQPEPGISRVLLIPTLVHRPWTLIDSHGHTKLFCYPARLENELTAPDETLIAIYRALGEGTRLRILRRLAAGTATVGRISEELDLAKSTVHEHLLSLRAAGLVRLVAGGFDLQPELPDLNWMLKEFLGLEMRRRCESCSTHLEPDSVAFICSYECTFCASCAALLNGTCPNCQGELAQRPRRARSATRRPNLPARHSGAR